MKKKIILLAATTALTAGVVTTGIVLAQTHMPSELIAKSVYTIEDNEFEVAFLEQYMNSSDLDSYSYVNDKPLGGNNAIGGHLYGNGKTTASDFVTNLNSGVNENLQWNISNLRVRGKSGPNRAYVQLETSSTHNIKDETAYPQATKPDEYGISHLFSSSYSHISAMYTTTAISNITDISIYWRSSYTKRAYICYQLEGETTWKKYVDIARNDAGDIKGNFAGTRGWDTFGYLTSKSSSWKTHELYGKTAKIAIACTEKASGEEGNFPISAILINANKAAVRYLNALTYRDNICSSNGENMFYDLRKSAADNVHNQDLFHLATEQADGEFLENYELAGTKTEVKNARDFYNMLASKVSGLGEVK